jgi:hypothetical protein
MDLRLLHACRSAVFSVPMDDAGPLAPIIDALVGALRRHEVDHFITGSLASSLHGEYRATRDIDVVADLSLEQLPGLVRDLEGDFFVDEAQARTAVAEGGSFNVVHRDSFFKVDLFPCASEFDREAMRRAETFTLPGTSEGLRVTTAEDILLAKLRWYRQGGEQSATQPRDIGQLIALNRPELDWPYIERWAGRLGVTDLLSRFRA